MLRAHERMASGEEPLSAGGPVAQSQVLDDAEEGQTSQQAVADERDRAPEESGVLNFRVAWNDGSPEMLMDLVNLKSIFAAQLPKMPREYIVRLVLDRRHRSMCIMKKRRVIGGICFRPFREQGFAEIVFCAITSSEQVKGYGTRIMNHLKQHVKTEGIEYFLTYADNYAIGYFRKQGFTMTVGMPKERWKGYIKDYDGGTLMECKISQSVNYLEIGQMIQQQRQQVHEKIKEVSNTHMVYTGLACFEEGKQQIDIQDIPGVKEAGWVPPSESQKSRERQQMAQQRNTPLAILQAKLGAVLKAIKNVKDSWPFKTAVDANLVPDYYTVITQPMDLENMGKKLNQRAYKTKEMFIADFLLIVSNCKRYNTPDTTYYRCAEVLEVKFKQLISEFAL